jgi:hypothetical protein
MPTRTLPKVPLEKSQQCGRIWTIGLGSLMALPLFYRLIAHFFTAYRHAGLAAMTLSFVLLAAVVLVGLILQRLAVVIGHLLDKTPKTLQRFLCCPILVRSSVAMVWLVVWVLFLVEGPQAQGAYGFIGLLRTDGVLSGLKQALFDR